MANSIRLIVHRGNVIFDSIIVSPCSLINCEQKARIIGNQVDDNANTTRKDIVRKVNGVCLNKKGCNAYVVSAYIATLTRSQVYREAVLKLLLHMVNRVANNGNLRAVLVRLRTPKKQFLDYKWSERITQMAIERREVDYAFSWLSTLGGAFSALGDEIQHCAEMAGKISLKQFELALRLGDPLLIARCKLYAALSLIQRGRLKVSERIIRNTYKYSVQQNDVRLQNMCLGIWAKLKYCYKIQRGQCKSVK